METIWTGVGGKRTPVTDIYVGVDGKRTPVTEVYVGAGGKAALVWKRETEEETV